MVCFRRLVFAPSFISNFLIANRRRCCAAGPMAWQKSHNGVSATPQYRDADKTHQRQQMVCLSNDEEAWRQAIL